MSYEDMSRKEILEDYTTVMNNITEHISVFPKFPDTAHALYAVYWANHVEEWFKKLKIIVGEEQ